MGKSKNKRKKGKKKGTTQTYKGAKTNMNGPQKIPVTAREKLQHEIQQVEQLRNETLQQLGNNRNEYIQHFANMAGTAAMEAVKHTKTVEEAIAYGQKFADILREGNKAYMEKINSDYVDPPQLIERLDDTTARLKILAPERFEAPEVLEPASEEDIVSPQVEEHPTENG